MDKQSIRTWFRTKIAAHPFTAVVAAFAVGFAAGAKLAASIARFFLGA